MRLNVSVGLTIWLGLASLSIGIAQQAVTTEAKILGNPAPAGTPVKELELKAKKYEFSPALIEVPANTLVRIHLTAVDREHGFEIKSLPGSCVRFKPGDPFTVEYYADKPGEVEFACCKFCGLGHGKMKGKLVVK